MTYSISPAPGNGVTFTPGPPARIGVSTTSTAASETSYTLTATDADGDTDTMTVSITVRKPVCADSAAVSGYTAPELVADCEALLASRDTLRGDQSLNWSEHMSIDNWQGVEIADNRVVGMDLSDLDLTGTIPSELGNLANLQSLDLGDNELTGEIPAELVSLANLQSLVLGWNELTGEIPTELGNLAKLQSLNLGRNELTGQIPAELGGLANLQGLHLSGNELTGEMPAELGNLANLQELNLHANQLTGEIPVWLGGLANLQSLNLDGNELTGEIPTELGNLANLQELNLGWNQLTGEIPAELGSLSNLEWLELSGNQLTGPVPVELGSLSNLERLDLSGNELTGPVPAEVGSLANLRELDLSSNQLTGPIPAEIGSLSNLREMYLSQNQLTGPIPAEMGSLANLQWLNLGANQLAGPIPAELGNLSNMVVLALSDNQLSGPIPSELGRLANLRSLVLSENQLEEEIPTELGSLRYLEELYLGGNQLTGCIPARLRDVPDNDLASLSLPFCEASQDACVTEGAVTDATNTGLVSDCETLLEARDTLAERGSLNWSANTLITEWDGIGDDSLEGSPQRVTRLYLNRLRLDGSIPSRLSGLTVLKVLHLHDNDLTGSIPPELGKLANLRELYLSGNRLTGCIPEGLRHVLENDFDLLGLLFCDDLRLAVPYDPFDDSFSPFDEQLNVAEAQVNSLIFSRLMRRSPSGVVPDLAASWEANDDGTEWIVNLRQDASFHDGRPVAAADVLYSIEAMNARFTALPHLANLELIDDVTLRVDFAEPSWDFPLRMTGASSVIVSEGMLEVGVDDFTQLVGSGPFRPVDYVAGNLLTLERNSHYYETGLPHLEGIRIFVIPDRATRTAAFLSGWLDYLGYPYDPYGGLPVLTVDEADRASKARPDVVFATYPIVLALWFDTQSAPFNDPRVRLAVLRAIDDATLMQFSELGKSEPQSSIPRAMFPTWTTFLDDPSAVEEWRRHDPDMSRALLAEAGYPDGFDTVMRIPENFPSYWDSVAEVVSEMLKRVDISVALERVPSSEHRTAPADRGIKLMEVLPFDGNAEAFLIEHFTAGGTYNHSQTDIVIPELDPDRPDSIVPVQQYLAEGVFYIPLPAPLYARSGRVRGPLHEGSSGSDLGTALSRVRLEPSCATGGAVANATNAGLVADCEALLAAKDVLAVSAPLNLSADTPMAQWEGVTLRGNTPRGVAGLTREGAERINPV